MRSICFTVFVISSGLVLGQVEDIKRKSEENARQKPRQASTERPEDDVGGGGLFIFDLFFRTLPAWQQFRLSAERSRHPSLVSAEVFVQGAANPPSYYFFWPRVRGNWGIFSTDFRMNYLLEQVSDGTFVHVRTNDWQVLQLNLITSRYLTLRVGNGMMNEAFAGRNTFYEWSVLLGIHNRVQTRMLGFEYRHARDFSTDSWPRLELSMQYLHSLLERGAFHTLFSAGLVYQNYYRTVPVFGFQFGLVTRIY